MRKLILLCLLVAACASETKTESSAAEEVSPAAPVAAPESVGMSFKAPGDHTPDEIYEKLRPLAVEGQRNQKRNTQHTEFSFSLPSEMPAGDPTKEWIQTQVKVYHKDQKTVNQITLETKNCNVAREKLDEKALQKRMQLLVAQISKTLFGMPFELSDKAFKDMSPDWSPVVRVPIKQEYLPVVDMRLIRSISKCDTRDGFGYRYDFFMK